MTPTVEGVILDLDGTVYRGDDPIDGAADAVGRLREMGLELCFCSNNPTKTPAEYVERLAGMGVEAAPSECLSAATVLRDYLRAEHPEAPTYLVGADALRRYLAAAGQDLVTDPGAASVFVASWDDSFGYATMQAALEGIDAETTFIGSDPDRVIPTDDGVQPGSGAIIAAIAETVGREPDRVLGKPSTEVAEAALDRLGVGPDACLVVGDRLDTDLAMGAAHGMDTALVLTGIADREDVAASDVDPDHVLDTLADLPAVLSTER